MLEDPKSVAPILPLAKPWLDEREADAARRAILSGWVTQGPEVRAFEQEFAEYTGAPFACAVSSCTTALHLALLTVGVQPGDEVVTASHSFIATSNAIRYCGAAPVFVDVDSRTFNIDPMQALAAITPRTRAILCVHQMGMPCDLAGIVGAARNRGLAVIEDAACAIGSEVRWNGDWQRIGRPQGDVACFSFHPRKVMTTGDGGMLTTASAEMDARFRLLRQHGMTTPDTTRHTSREVHFECYEGVGYNYRMTDIQAAVGREQLRKLPVLVQRRRALAARYREKLASIPGLRLPHEPHWARSNWQSYCVRLPDHCDQRAVMQALLDTGIATRRGVMCAHREQAYREESAVPLPHSETAQDHSIVLPLFHEMTESEQDYVCRTLAKVCAQPAARAA